MSIIATPSYEGQGNRRGGIRKTLVLSVISMSYMRKTADPSRGIRHGRRIHRQRYFDLFAAAL